MSRQNLVLKLVYACAVICISKASYGQDSSLKLSTGSDNHAVQLNYTGETFDFQASIEEIKLSIQDGNEDHFSVQIRGFQPAGEMGGPALPQYSVLLEAGKNDQPRISILSMDSITYDLKSLGLKAGIIAYKESQRKTPASIQGRAEPLRAKGENWLGLPLVSLEYEGLMRGVPVSSLRFNPVKYNPATGQLKLYHDVSLQVETGPGQFRVARQVPSRAFNGILKRVIRKEDYGAKKAIFSEEPLTLVILSDTLFREALQPLIRWKTKKGFRIVEAYRQDQQVGSTRDSIKNYLKQLYHTPPPGVASPSYLLIVGDVEHIPVSQSSGEITDLYYAEYDGGGDYLPEIFYGRISVETPEQLQAVMEKILNYEQYLFPDPTYLEKSVLIAGVDGAFAATHGNGQIRYAQENYLNETYGNTATTYYYPESDTSDQAILDNISEGVGFVNYTGHGLYDRWINPTFHQNDIDDLTNYGKYPLMIGNGCETNVFNLGECFAEALLRAPGKGALAYIGCTNDSYWDEDFYWAVGVGPILSRPVYSGSSPGYYDKVFHTHDEPYHIWTPSLGEMIFGGNMAVQQSFTSRKKFYWEIYQLAGDPSIVPWFSVPELQDVSHPEMLPPGSTRFDVSCPPFGYVALSYEGILLDAKFASAEGYVTLHLPDSLQAGALDLVVSGNKFIPHIDQISIGQPAQPYLDLLSVQYSSESEEADQLISPGETLSLDLEFVNRGSEDLNGDTLILFSYSSNAVVHDSLFFVGALPSGDSLLIEQAFSFSAGSEAKDQTIVLFGLYRKGAKGNITYLKEKIHAPALASRGITWDDRTLGDGDGIADPGEWLQCEWTLLNQGHYRSGPVSGYSAQDSSVITQVSFESLPQVEAGDTAILHFRVLVGENENHYEQAGPFTAGDDHVHVKDSFMLFPGRHFEDFNVYTPGNYPIASMSDSPWSFDLEWFNSGPSSFRSGSVSNFGISELSVSFENILSDSITFFRRVSSESAYDFLKVYLDSMLIHSWSGEVPWARISIPLSPGLHNLTWIYQKDQSISKGQDAAWVDDIVFPSTAFRGTDLSILSISDPESGPWLTDEEEIHLLLRNTGLDTIRSFLVQVTLDEIPRWSDTITEVILPGKEISATVPVLMDMSELGLYALGASASAPHDYYRGNDFVEKTVHHYIYPDISLTLSSIDHLQGLYMDAIITVENEGNVTLDSIRYEILVDQIRTDSAMRYIKLSPGQNTEERFRVLDSSFSDFSSGLFGYRISKLENDSVNANNDVRGEFQWIVLAQDFPPNKRALMVYPNPAGELLYLKMDKPAPNDMGIELRALTGSLIGSYVMEKGMDMLKIPAPGTAGLYHLYIEEKNRSIPVVFTE